MILEQAIEHAERHLPKWWKITIRIRNGSTTVTTERPDGDDVDMDDLYSDLQEQVSSGVKLAHDEIEADRLSEENVKGMASARCGLNELDG